MLRSWVGPTKTGSIKKGKYADLTELQRVKFVMKGGKVIVSYNK